MVEPSAGRPAALDPEAASETPASARAPERMDAAAEDAEIARLLEENRRLRAELSRMSPLAEVGLLSAGAAHDLNNLLQLIAGTAAQLSPAAEPERVTLRRLNEATESACDLAHGLARWGRAGTSSDLTCDLSSAAAQVADLASASAPAGATVRLELAPGMPRARIAPHAAHRIVLNLLINAWQALRGAEGQVALRTGVAESSRVWIEVEDTGVGLDEETRTRLFEPFFTTEPDGSGLGLSVIRALVDPAGGEIEVWSESGRGARFRVTLPAQSLSGSAPA